MEQIRLIMLVESRIRGNVYVRFGGEFLKTSHSNMERRWELSLPQGDREDLRAGQEVLRCTEVGEQPRQRCTQGAADHPHGG